MRIRVLHVIDHLGYGGAPLVLKNIVERLDDSKFEPVVCALRPNQKPIQIDVETVTLDIARYSPRAAWALNKLCSDHRIDLIHAHLSKSIIASLFVRRPVPIIVHEHGAILRKNLSGRLFRGLLRSLSNRIGVAIGISQATVEELQKVTSLSKDRMVKIPNFVDMRRFTVARYDRAQIRQKYAISPDEWVLGFVGRLHKYKGADILIDAIALLRDRKVRCRALLVGDGVEGKALQEQIRRLGLEELVLLVGLAENPAEVMAAFDIGVVPSRLEGFGLVAAELMAMQVPVVASAVGGLPELIKDGQNGVLVRPCHASKLARVLEQMLNDANLRDRLQKEAQVQISQYDGLKQVRKIEQLYHQLVIRHSEP